MANTKNLRPFNALSPEQHREISRKGGLASGKSRREKRRAINDKKADKRAESELLREMVMLYKLIARK